MEPQVWTEFMPWLVGGGVAVAIVSTLGWIHTIKLKMKHGYPLEGMWGQPLKPSTDGESKERIKLLTQENAHLQAELGAVKDRLANVERIVTDSGYRLSHEIERLRDEREKVQ
jgi:hypothetical protein